MVEGFACDTEDRAVVRDLTQAEIDFFTYSAAHYVQLKNDYLGTR